MRLNNPFWVTKMATKQGIEGTNKKDQNTGRSNSDGPDQMNILSGKGVAFLYRPLPKPRPGTDLKISWKWRVNASSPPTALKNKGTDDRPIALHIWFEDKEAASRRFNWLERAVANILAIPRKNVDL